MFCPQCHTEYRAGFDRCADCDISLVEILPETPNTTVKQDFYQGKLINVANLTSQSDISLLKAMFASEGVPYVVQNDGPAFVLAGSAVPTSFHVPEEEQDRATDVVKQLAHGYQSAEGED